MARSQSTTPTHIIVLEGCDDSNHLALKLTPSEVKLLQKIAEASKKLQNGYDCKPTLSLFDRKDLATDFMTQQATQRAIQNLASYRRSQREEGSV